MFVCLIISMVIWFSSYWYFLVIILPSYMYHFLSKANKTKNKTKLDTGKTEYTNLNCHYCQFYLSKFVFLGLVGPELRGPRPIQSLSPFKLSPGFNKKRSSSSRTESSHWTRHSGARAMCSFISNGANFPHAAASVWNGKVAVIYLYYIIQLTIFS